MTDHDLHQPGPGPLRAAARAVELPQAVTRLVSIDGCRLADSNPLAPLARDIARSMTETGLTAHHCAQHDLLLLDWDRYGTYAGTQQAMNTALGGVLRAFGYPIAPFGSGGASLVTGRRETETGR